MFFNNWNKIIEIIIIGVLAYISFLVLLRVSGKRSLAKLNAFDLIVSVAIGSIFASTITSDGLTLLDGIVAAAILLFLQFIISKLSERSQKFEKLIQAEPALLYYGNKFNRIAMKNERISEREILFCGKIARNFRSCKC